MYHKKVILDIKIRPEDHEKDPGNLEKIIKFT
jgi:translation elongation factor EF-1beta